jgi:hypothetical protein
MPECQTNLNLILLQKALTGLCDLEEVERIVADVFDVVSVTWL